MGWGNPILGGTALMRAAIQNPGFVSGSEGWTVNQDGSAEFNDVTIRGSETVGGSITITQADGTILVINDEFITYYDSTGANVIGQVAVFDVTSGLSLTGRNGVASSALYLIGDAAGSVVTPGIIAANEPGQTAGTPEPWHSLGSAGSTGCTLNEGRYRLTADGECEIDIALTAGSGGSTAGTYTWSNTLPSAYQFSGNFSRAYSMGYVDPVSAGSENPAIVVDGSGTATPGRVRMFLPAFGANTLFTVTARIPAN